MSNGNKDQKDQIEKILQLVQSAIQQDQELREKYKIGDKFRFIRDRLIALQSRIEEQINAMQKETEKKTDLITEDEVMVYVHLFNAQGLVFQTWQKMISPSVFYEYSVNRPVYAEKSLVESFIRSRPNKVQHGFIGVIIKKQDILSIPDAEMTKDAVGNPLIKIREGSLLFNRFSSFVHNGHEYVLNEEKLVKKED